MVIMPRRDVNCEIEFNVTMNQIQSLGTAVEIMIFWIINELVVKNQR